MTAVLTLGADGVRLSTTGGGRWDHPSTPGVRGRLLKKNADALLQRLSRKLGHPRDLVRFTPEERLAYEKDRAAFESGFNGQTFF